jgi:GT2 family glycosyltransferase
VLTDVLVPGNRWDLLDPYPVPRPAVSVVIAHFEQPAQLARTWAALCAQTLPPFEVVIADDGSARPPLPPRGGPPVRVVTQPDRGFRAAAARNLGAAHTTGEVVVFLDADTVPDRGFVAALTRRVALCPDVLAVGRRRHADLSDLPPGADPATAPRLAEPRWLSDGYAASRDLLDADGRSFRYVISAVLACRRSLFDDLGGFDERYVGYGGEDWDLGYRAWNAGAVLVHEREAVAWHDGPDWAGRPEDRSAKELESIRLAALIPEPSTRGAALPFALPDVLVDVAPAQSVAETARTVHSLLRQTHRDLRIRLLEPVDPALAQLYDGGMQCTPWSGDQLRRARVRLRVDRPLPEDSVAEAVRTLTATGLGQLALSTEGLHAASATSTRVIGRARRWARRFPDRRVVLDVFGCVDLEVGPCPPSRDDLAAFFDLGSRCGPAV